ncbi:MAG: HAMP domain-containing sensor histidine kinase [Oxalicibacterium faecigallinarum]|uniref:sensor histidine kinase n=1 Tax=Oxalicibacterium faecigallinarum TaxID=573741 RepID=UPI002806E1E8|nr:HAMP domain-containing sensor histidine kinase [Oxalicibacterium faecigallinarum]MDQ7969364.1 HAMP domain-containing sensor histidine kinase [Oxalicibacterium faecigallinarum]
MSDAKKSWFAWPNRLYVRIYLAVIISLVIGGLLVVTAWRWNAEYRQIGPSLESFAAIAADVLPPAYATNEEQYRALRRWQSRMRADLTLYSAEREVIASIGKPLPPLDDEQTTSGWLGGTPPFYAVKLPDGRWLVGERSERGEGRRRPPPFGFVTTLALIGLVIGIGCYPIVRRLTRRLERLQTSVEALGAGQLSTRIAVEGRDEVASLAASFNRSAARIEALVNAQKTLLANASHELRSPLARIRMAVELTASDAQPEIRDELKRNIAELDQLIDEILLASRLDATADTAQAFTPVDLTALVAEECARISAEFDAELDSDTLELPGDARLLRRMVRNLLENARRYGNGTPINVRLTRTAGNKIVLQVCDGGPGVPAGERENIFEPFYRLSGASEREGGVGLGLSLVRQIARRHGGEVICVGRDEPGSCFEVTLPA